MCLCVYLLYFCSVFVVFAGNSPWRKPNCKLCEVCSSVFNLYLCLLYSCSVFVVFVLFICFICVVYLLYFPETVHREDLTVSSAKFVPQSAIYFEVSPRVSTPRPI